MDLKSCVVLVAGLGKSGLAAIELLVEEGAIPRGTDAKPLTEVAAAGPVLERLGVPFVPFTAESFRTARMVVLSPGVPLDLPEVLAAREAGVPVIGEVELASRYLRGPVIGITGSNGKTTTTALTGHILQHCGVDAQVGGNIGLPPTAMVKTAAEERWNVLELSSFQLETVEEFHADVAAVLNITQNHLDRHHTFEKYVEAKRRLLETQRPGSVTVLNASDPVSTSLAYAVRGEIEWFSREDRPMSRGWWFDGTRIFHDGKPVMERSQIPLRGLHNVENVMAAAACAHRAGAALEGIGPAVSTFPGVEHRIEFVRELHGVKYYNDSKATSVDATLKAIEGFDGGLWIILGGKDKGSDYRPLIAPLRQKARGVLLIGAASEKIASQIGGEISLQPCEYLEKAVDIAAGSAKRGDVVLLAPACASYDQFNNFEERGRAFKTFVGRLV
jgi:UDP-N-acetylmuramoylalanine--D-glutamate ligase